MSQGNYIWIYLVLAIVAANLPWLSERLFFVVHSAKGKGPWFRLLEWAVLYFVIGAIGLGLERRLTGEIYHQGWVFYVVTIALFLVFALPGFIYRYDLRRQLSGRKQAVSNKVDPSSCQS
ncbi:MAG: DUF2818 family protein [Acidihalobacter sp.]|uniref:DUF2818 family protein n=1 Tax=Acidihalobacter sp. TaxID=1872108 RepID=UPI00307EBBB4